VEYRKLGNSGLMVSVVGLGTNNFGRRLDAGIDAERAEAVVSECLAQGINFFDTADVYGGRGPSEEYLGRALKGRRGDAVVATKFAIPMGDGPMKSGGSRRYIMEAVEASLRRLDMDYIDLYQMHRPDPDTPIEETLRAIDDLVTSGKVRYFGVSNYAGWQIAEAQLTARAGGFVPLLSIQSEYNMLNRSLDAEVIPAARKFGLGLLPFYPLASGLLTGKYRRGATAEAGRLAKGSDAISGYTLSDDNFDRVEALERFAQERGHTILELAFSWLASQDYVGSIIAGATRPEQVTANAAAAAGWRLTADELAEVDRLTK
jgi:aryl-alcohol dehydrogenase-like predicted oxidoreductase